MEKKQNVPALRFQGFSGEWEKYNLSMLSGVITKGTTPLDKSGKGDVNFIKIENIDANTGAIHVTQKISQEEHNGYLKRSQLKENDILFSIAGTLGRVAVVKANLLPANTNQALAIIRLKKGNFQYVKTYLQGKAVENFLKANPTVGAQPNLSLAQVGDLEVVMPEESKEQENISDFFQYWDELIFHTMAKIKRLRQFRQAMLTKLFPREGAAEPELRFRGFSGKWVSKSFGKLFDMLPTNTLSRSDLNNKCGEIRDVHYGDILVKYNDLIDVKDKDLPFISRNIEVKMNALLKDGDIIIADTAEDMTVGKCVEMVNVGEEKVVSGLHTIACRPLESFAPGFLGYFFNSHLYHNQLIPLMQGIKVTSISKTALKSTVIYFPSEIEEQKRIGQFFMKLDSYISLQQKKLERMQRLKAALLEKLFV